MEKTRKFMRIHRLGVQFFLPYRLPVPQATKSYSEKLINHSFFNLISAADKTIRRRRNSVFREGNQQILSSLLRKNDRFVLIGDMCYHCICYKLAGYRKSALVFFVRFL